MRLLRRCFSANCRRRKAAHRRDLRHQVTLGTEGALGDLYGVRAQAVNGRTYQDDAGHTHDDAQQRKEAAQFMGADGIQS